MIEVDRSFDIEYFISGAKNTANNLERNWVVTTERGDRLGGCGIIMMRLIDLLEGSLAKIKELEERLDDAHEI